MSNLFRHLPQDTACDLQQDEKKALQFLLFSQEITYFIWYTSPVIKISEENSLYLVDSLYFYGIWSEQMEF